MTVSHLDPSQERPRSADATQPVVSAPPAPPSVPAGTGVPATAPIPVRGYSAEAVHWPAPPQDAVLQDAPFAPIAAPAGGPAGVPRWSGRRTAAVAALALALTSAGALAAAAATPNGITGPAELRGGPGGGQGFQNRQFGPGGPGQQGQQGQQGNGAQQQPGMGMPGQGRGTH